MKQPEFDAILADKSKKIIGDISWKSDLDHAPAIEFRAEILSDAGYPLIMCGSYSGEAQTLTFAMIHRGVGRIYGLDLGKNTEIQTGAWSEKSINIRGESPRKPSLPMSQGTSPMALLIRLQCGTNFAQRHLFHIKERFPRHRTTRKESYSNDCRAM